MAVEKQIYTVLPPWTQDELAGAFLNAFVDAQLMINWTDSFLSGVHENRILQVTTAPERTYGMAGYWFNFTTDGFYLQPVGGWDPVTHSPTGSQHYDYINNDAQRTDEDTRKKIVTLQNTQNVELTRYTSSIDPTFSWFLVQQGTTAVNFHIGGVNEKPIGFLDQDLFRYWNWLQCGTDTSGNAGRVWFYRRFRTRRSYPGQDSNGDTGYYRRRMVTHTETTHVYTAQGYGNASARSYATGNWVVPFLESDAISGLSVDRKAIMTRITPSIYSQNLFPDDFAISFHGNDNTMERQDRLIVEQNVEEWEIIWRSNNGLSPSTGYYPSPLFICRVV